MIYFIKEGAHKRIGLNIYRSKGGFVIGWVWYDVKSHELHGWRFRFRSHMKPRFLFSRSRQSVIESYLSVRDAVVVERSLIEDYSPQLDAIVRLRIAKAAKHRLDMTPRV